MAEPVAPDGLADLTGDVLDDWTTRQRTRCLALYELILEATRRPALTQAPHCHHVLRGAEPKATIMQPS